LTATQTTKPAQTILCIEDEQPLLRVRIALLESVGYRVFGAQTANAAMALFVQNEIDLVLSDHMLCGVSGAELSIFMKQVRPGVAIVLLSGSHLPANIRQQVGRMHREGPPYARAPRLPPGRAREAGGAAKGPTRGPAWRCLINNLRRSYHLT
jgi:CheY-like chemotaxis protein